MEHQKHEDIKISYRHRQTRIGEQQAKQTHNQHSEKSGPEEEGSNMRDCTARRTHNEKTNNTYGILYNDEKEDEHCKDHVMLIQEHWILNEELHTWETLAYLKGWQG
eukprot:13292641-Heterocapsa_arctica.AAC.1